LGMSKRGETLNGQESEKGPARRAVLHTGKKRYSASFLGRDGVREVEERGGQHLGLGGDTTANLIMI